MIIGVTVVIMKAIRMRRFSYKFTPLVLVLVLFAAFHAFIPLNVQASTDEQVPHHHQLPAQNEDTSHVECPSNVHQYIPKQFNENLVDITQACFTPMDVNVFQSIFQDMPEPRILFKVFLMFEEKTVLQI